MRNASKTFVRLLIGASIGCHAYAIAGVEGTTTVYPTGVFPDDVAHVQAAVAGGGDVLLVATDSFGTSMHFNFGPATNDGGQVQVRTHVVIRGTGSGNSMTTIDGGAVPFNVVMPNVVTIEGIDFEGPLDAAIGVSRSLQAVIIDNVIRNVIPAVAQDGSTQAFGIVVNSGSGPFSNITGTILIAGNLIEGIPADAGYGIVSAHHDAAAMIEDNRIFGANLNGILAGFISKDVLIRHNVVAPGPAEATESSAGNGILVGHPRGGRFAIVGNTVECVNPLADGIVFVGSTQYPVDGSIVSHNRVAMKASSYGGISLYDAVSHVIVSDNDVSGDSAYALQIATASASDPDTAIGNVLARNSVEHALVSSSDVFLDINAADSLLCAQPGSLIDNGDGTVVRTACPGAVAARAVSARMGTPSRTGAQPRKTIDEPDERFTWPTIPASEAEH